MRTCWADLPETVRAELEHRIGQVRDAREVHEGQNIDICAVLTTETGTASVKAVECVNIHRRWLRTELAAATHTGGIAPRVLAHADVAAGRPWCSSDSTAGPRVSCRDRRTCGRWPTWR
ncbi:hypothetical protein ABZ816_00280 [Actinosynnema sp. NPDC047251]|uniref:Uncharacterized protein n=1 Tax=Saccharothrix espanaensis (strain ATCC 51144 / DSM 44229 / JCM 9112 / NBRC 15066 / NRRL 15764) TaxID=1179773 RepID=K0K2C1_SACES|nr:hypothetical protein [Saccharothrix espanaensis]CCH30688.1 hypothetical protein BN6_33900 [Saccharothrix espanaensis DSM 44229]